MKASLALVVVLGFLGGSLVLPDTDTFYVDPAKGLDTHPGTMEQPWKTLGFADSRVRPGDTVLLVGGLYREEFKPTASGTDQKPIIYKAADLKNPPIFEGGAEITGWKKHDEKRNIWVAELPMDHEPSALFQDDRKMLPAQWPSQTNPEDPYDLSKMLEITQAGANPATDLLDPEHLRQPAGTFDGGIVVHYSAEGNGVCFKKIIAHDPEKGMITAVGVEGAWQEKRPFGDPKKSSRKDRYAIRNCMFALDDPGEWLVNTHSKPFKAYLIPLVGQDPNQSLIMATARTHAITSARKSLANITFDGLTFRHFHDATHRYRPAQAMITLTGGTFINTRQPGEVRNITFRNCAIYHNYHRCVTDLRGDGFLVENSHVWGNEMTVNTGALHIVRGRNARIINNRIHHNVGDGLWVGTGGGEPPFAVDGLEVRGNHIHNHDSRKDHCDDVQMHAADNVLFIENRFNKAESTGQILQFGKSGKLTFTGNSFDSGVLAIHDARELHVLNNVFRENLFRLDGRASEHYGAHKIVFRNNVVIDSGVWVTRRSSSNWKDLESIEADHNYYYVDDQAEPRRGPWSCARSAEWQVLESYSRLKDTFPQDKRRDSLWLRDAARNEQDKWGFALSPTSIDGMSRKMSPADLFVNPEEGDFHLKAGSPLIDAGVDVGQPLKGKAPDIGAYEFTPPQAEGGK